MDFLFLLFIAPFIVLLTGTGIACYSFGKSQGIRWGYQQGLRVADAYKQQFEQLEGAIKQ